MTSKSVYYDADDYEWLRTTGRKRWRVAVLNDQNIWEMGRTGLTHDEAISYAASTRKCAVDGIRILNGLEGGTSGRVLDMVRHNREVGSWEDEYRIW